MLIKILNKLYFLYFLIQLNNYTQKKIFWKLLLNAAFAVDIKQYWETDSILDSYN